MSNLVEKASIILTPTAYSDGTLHSIKPIQTFGSEIVVNGNYETDSDWSKGTGCTIENGKANLLNAAAFGFALSQTPSFIVGRKYLVEYSILQHTTGSIRVRLGSNLGTTRNGNGTFTETIVAQANSIIFQPTSIFTGSIDNVSAKEIIDADFDFTRGSSATRVNEQGLIEDVQILSGELVQNGDFEQIGSELVTNGDFDTDSDWVKSSGVTISNGSAHIISDGSYQRLTQSGILTVGKKYKIQYEIVENNGGQLKMSSFSGAILGIQSTVGVYTIYAEALQTYLTIERIASCDIKIDNVSVKEVGQNWTVNNSDANNFVAFDGSTARLKFLNTSPVTQLVTSFIMTAGKKYKLTVDVALATSGSIKIDGNGISETFNTSGITTRIINPTGSTAIKFYRASADVDITLNSVSLIEITDDTNLPRIDYTDGTGSLLLEPQSTNTATYSNDFTQGDIFNSSSDPALTGAILNSQQATSPDGTNNAWLLKDNNGGGSGVVALRYPSTNVTSNHFNTLSIFVKKALSNDFIILKSGAFDSSGNGSTWFNVNNGTLGDISSNHTAKIEDYGNGYYRCSITFKTVTDVSGPVQLQLASTNGSDQVTKDGTNGVYIFGLQCEADASQNFATSYIPTSGSAVTRNADEANNSGSSDLINSTEGVIYAEISSLANDGTSRRISLSDGGSSDRLEIFYGAIANRIDYHIYSGSSFQASGFSLLSSATDFNKIAVKYKENDFALWVNGTEASTDTSGSSPIGLNKLQLQDASGSNDFYGKVKSVAVFKEALTDAQLAALTS